MVLPAILRRFLWAGVSVTGRASDVGKRVLKSDEEESRAGFECFVRQVSPALLGYFARRIIPREEAADCVAEVLLILWEKRTKLPEGNDERRAWTFGIARNVLRTATRRSVRHYTIAEALRQELMLTGRSEPSSAGEASGLQAALLELSNSDRELVLLIAWEGFSLADAAALLGIRADAARARYSRARRRLSSQLEAQAAAKYAGPS